MESIFVRINGDSAVQALGRFDQEPLKQWTAVVRERTPRDPGEIELEIQRGDLRWNGPGIITHVTFDSTVGTFTSTIKSAGRMTESHAE